MRRILIFCHYNKHNNLSDHVLYTLSHIKHIYNRIVFVSNSGIDVEKQAIIRNYCDDIQLRENKGYDFGAWKDALLKEGWDKLSEYDNLTLMNDTCFGPLYDLEPLYTQMEAKDIDFWGLTDHYGLTTRISGKKISIPPHIQSYFICFKNVVIKSLFFRKLWKNVKYEKKVETVISKYETRLTALLKKNGFTCSSVLKAHNEVNISIKSPDLCIINSIPFIKVKSFLYFPYPEFIQQLIHDKTDYPVSLIADHLSDIYDPSISFTTTNKIFIPESRPVNKSFIPQPKIAIHLHIFYLDIFEKYAATFDEWTVEYHLYITTDTLEKKQAIIDCFKNHPSYKNLEEIILFENHGRDILPWLSISDKLETYDIVGHFHTKKTINANPSVGMLWQQDLLDSLLLPVNAIIDIFNTNKKIGIIIPDIPRHFQSNPLISSHEKKLGILMNNLWKNMDCKKNIDFLELTAFVFPYGNMFWYRPSALRPLFILKPETMDIPKEPLPDNSILHCLERMLVYIAWSEGFDFLISARSVPQVSSFHANYVLNKYVNNYIKEYENSKSYRIGRLILTVPRLIKIYTAKLYKKR